jgi:hypothetical protein
MKILMIAVMCFSMGVVHAQTETISAVDAAEETEVVSNEAIDVDGYLAEKKATDGELEGLHAEIRKQKQETVLNKVKSKSYQELTKSVEKLSETTEEYIEDKKNAQAEIAAYNLKVKCLNAESPGPECAKHVRRR